ncbi:MAG TPA: Gfo/Idh/MocA family oxidoreductase [Candidatus Hydrogenedentes bacterium]|nr:Gfo/Idh/MocA family oxidoreductase [Candidatus Hydrogenedentota bacterium]HRT20597.1 Gfo/Idh/MocA family oxidoreductase [Candidatus Hydrogenedentota bacterium]HRT65396.1 Gfo/Idh/MocA family oxidoreductase [Candidatus Hydrogenedentota bacterium]
MSKIRVGVVGVGHLGYHHARNYAALEGVVLAGVVDSDEGRRAKAARDFSAPGFASVAELLAAGVEAASVAVPTTAHAEVAMALLNAGVDVLVEKPMAATCEEAVRMKAAAAANGRILQVGHIERFNGAVMALMQAVSDPKFIECHRLSPYPNRGHDVSVVLDLMIHDLDIVLALVRSPVASIDAVGVDVFSPSEDIANVRIRFASGCVANLTCSRVAAERMRKIRVFSGDAYFSTDYSEQEVLSYRKKPGPVPEGVSPMLHIDVQPLPVVRDEPLKLELASFIDCVRTRARPVVSGEDGLAAMRLAQDIVDFIREHP